MLGVHRRQRLQRGDALLLALADPDQDPRGERDPQLAGRADRLQAPGRVLRRRARVHGVHQPLGDRLQHQSLRGGHLAQPRQVLAREDAEVGVRQDPPLQRPLARPDDVGGEVGVPVLPQPARHLRVDLGPLAGQHQQLLDPAPRGAVDDREHLLGRVQVRRVRRERAVLAVAPARARERQRQVARVGDPPAHRPECMTSLVGSRVGSRGGRRSCPAPAPSASRFDPSDPSFRVFSCPKTPFAAPLPRWSARSR